MDWGGSQKQFRIRHKDDERNRPSPELLPENTMKQARQAPIGPIRSSALDALFSKPEWVIIETSSVQTLQSPLVHRR